MKFHEILVLLATAVPLLAAADGSMGMPSRALHAEAAAPVAFRAAALIPIDAVALAPLEKAQAASEEQPGGRLRVGTVRTLAKATRVDAWTSVAGGYVTKLRAASEQAQGLRIRLDLGTLPGVIEARVQGTEGRIEWMLIDPVLGPEAWTPWTEGSVQVIELFSPVLPSPGAVRLGAVGHFTDSPLVAKAAAACTVSTMCTTNDAALDAAIAERKKSVMKLTFTDSGSFFLCSATLINTERFPAAYVLTANHCINNAASAASISTLWFYENLDCDSGIINTNSVQVAGGAQLVFTNNNVDSTLLLMNRTPPAGAVYSGWNPARLTAGTPIVSISHPSGDTSRYALGRIDQEYRIEGRPQDEYGVIYSRGIIQGGSSGSGLFTLANGSLQLRGILTGTTVRSSDGLSCTNLNEDGLYSRFEIFEPEIDQYIRIAPQAADDAPNRAQDLFNAPVTDPNGVDMPLNLRTTPLVFSNKRIDYAGDLDIYRFTLTRESAVHVWTQSAIDTVGSILDSNGVNVEANDDEVSGDVDFGITHTLPPGTYYVQVGHWDANGVGAYTLNLSATATSTLPTTNYTDLWWNAAESGWGININHQGNILFATLFTYDAGGAPMWLVMSDGERQSDGSYQGTLFRTTGPAFDAVPWNASAVTSTSAGTMRLTFSTANAGTLAYTVNGVSVTKAITRQVFSTPPTCTFTVTGARDLANNFQDLWWNPTESGWGLNVSQQGNVIFATLFNYDATGRGVWYVMSNGNRTGLAANFTGTLFRVSGPAFNANPWTAVTATPVGTMTLSFGAGTIGTLIYTVDGVQVTKFIVRQVFSSPVTLCQ